MFEMPIPNTLPSPAVRLSGEWIFCSYYSVVEKCLHIFYFQERVMFEMPIPNTLPSPAVRLPVSGFFDPMILLSRNVYICKTPDNYEVNNCCQLFQRSNAHLGP